MSTIRTQTMGARLGGQQLRATLGAPSLLSARIGTGQQFLAKLTRTGFSASLGVPTMLASLSIGTQGPPGPEGPPGPPGPQGPPGPSGQSANVAEYLFSNNTSTPPGAGQIRFNTSDQTLTTQIWMDNEQATGPDIGNLLAAVRPGTELYIQDKDDSERWQRYVMTDDFVPYALGYVEFPVLWLEGAAPLPEQRVSVVFITRGEPGPEGPPGPPMEVQDEGVSLSALNILNFAGAGVTAAADATKITVTIPGATGGGAVDSVFGRTGAITAQAGDYTAAQVTNAVSATGSYSDPVWITSIDWGKISGEPAGFPPSAHTHVVADVTGAVPDTRTIIAGAGLTGGGALSGNVTLSANVAGIQTPWLQNIAAAGYTLGNTGKVLIGTASDIGALCYIHAGALAAAQGTTKQAAVYEVNSSNSDRLQIVAYREAGSTDYHGALWSISRLIDGTFGTGQIQFADNLLRFVAGASTVVMDLLPAEVRLTAAATTVTGTLQTPKNILLTGGEAGAGTWYYADGSQRAFFGMDGASTTVWRVYSPAKGQNVFGIDLSTGTSGPVFSAWNSAHMVMGTYHLWVDASGRLRIQSGPPASDTAGVVVGTQL